MFLELNHKSGRPAYAQIADQVRHAAASGKLRAGDQLPTIRELAERLRVNRNTVAKAYAELETEGVVASRQGSGVFVAERGSTPLARKYRDRILAETIDAAIVQAHHFKVEDEDLVALVRRRLEDFAKRRAAAEAQAK